MSHPERIKFTGSQELVTITLHEAPCTLIYVYILEEANLGIWVDKWNILCRSSLLTMACEDSTLNIENYEETLINI